VSGRVAIRLLGAAGSPRGLRLRQAAGGIRAYESIAERFGSSLCGPPSPGPSPAGGEGSGSRITLLRHFRPVEPHQFPRSPSEAGVRRARGEGGQGERGGPDGRARTQLFPREFLEAVKKPRTPVTGWSHVHRPSLRASCQVHSIGGSEIRFLHSFLVVLSLRPLSIIPANAGSEAERVPAAPSNVVRQGWQRRWIPACAGMTTAVCAASSHFPRKPLSEVATQRKRRIGDEVGMRFVPAR
jgi:hypothetical protein